MKNYIKKLKKVYYNISLNKRILNHSVSGELISKELLSYNLIADLAPKNFFFPITAWSISPTAINHIVNDIIINKREAIIEFGPGYSTLIIASLIKKESLNVNFFSIESNLEWLNLMQQFLKKEGLEQYVTLIHAPIGKSSYTFQDHKEWYDLDFILKNIGKINFDLAIIDGPPGAFKYSRYGAVPFLQSRLKDSFSIFIDDTNRNEERNIAIELQNQVNQPLFHLNGYSILKTEASFDSVPLIYKNIVN